MCVRRFLRSILLQRHSLRQISWAYVDPQSHLHKLQELGDQLGKVPLIISGLWYVLLQLLYNRI